MVALVKGYLKKHRLKMRHLGTIHYAATNNGFGRIDPSVVHGGVIVVHSASWLQTKDTILMVCVIDNSSLCVKVSLN